MGQIISVIAKAGCICPRENPREPVITDIDVVPVIKSRYYTRLLADGSLHLVPEKPVKKEKGGSQ
jgi:hypothetical protein